VTAPHQARAERRKTGWRRWYAACSTCPWFEWGTSKESAELLAKGHERRWAKLQERHNLEPKP
jgi:hypothetical protein